MLERNYVYIRSHTYTYAYMKCIMESVCVCDRKEINKIRTMIITLPNYNNDYDNCKSNHTDSIEDANIDIDDNDTNHE